MSPRHLCNIIIIIITTDISKRTINDKSSQRHTQRQSNQTTKSSVFSFRRIIRAGSRSTDVSEFQDVGPEDEKALGPNVTVFIDYVAGSVHRHSQVGAGAHPRARMENIFSLT